MDIKTYTTSKEQTSSKKIKLVLLMVVVGLVIYFIPPRHGAPNMVVSLLFVLFIEAVFFYQGFIKMYVVQITINPKQNKIETQHQNGLNYKNTVVQPLNQSTTEYLDYATRGGKDYNLVIKDHKNIIRIAEKDGFSITTLLEIKQTIDGYCHP